MKFLLRLDNIPYFTLLPDDAAKDSSVLESFPTTR